MRSKIRRFARCGGAHAPRRCRPTAMSQHEPHNSSRRAIRSSAVGVALGWLLVWPTPGRSVDGDGVRGRLHARVPCERRSGPDRDGTRRESVVHREHRAFSLPVLAPSVTTGQVATLLPALSGLRLRPARLHGVRRGRRRTGATIIHSDTAPATTTFTSERCGSARRRCPVLGTLTHIDRVGLSRVRFPGRVRGGPLGPGKYALVAVATTADGTGRPVTARFQVTR
jgi:hypothetical protein